MPLHFEDDAFSALFNLQPLVLLSYPSHMDPMETGFPLVFGIGVLMLSFTKGGRFWMTSSNIGKY